MTSGKIAWRSRELGRVHLIVAGDRTLALGINGRLSLLTLSPEGLEIHSQVQLFQDDGFIVPSLVGDLLSLRDQVFTVPSLVGYRLYLRDQKKMLALELPGREPGG